MNALLSAAALVAALSTVGGAGWWAKDNLATVEMVGANAEQIAIIRIENAARSGNRDLLIRLCDDFQRVHGWRPSACR